MFARSHILHNSSGFTFVEQLVAVALISIGMLAMANLHISAAQSERGSVYRSRALALSESMAEMIRSNKEAAFTLAYEAAASDTGTDNNCDALAGGQACSAAQMAAHDIWLWKQQITAPQIGLPDGTAVIASDGATLPTYTITIAWTNSGETESYHAVVSL